MQYDKILCDIFITTKKKINNNNIKKLLNGCYPLISYYLLHRYSDCYFNTFKEIIWRMYYHIEQANVCQICGNITKFDFKNKCYKKYCCAKCSALSKERNEKYQSTCLKKYGHINPLHSELLKDKIESICLERYGEKRPCDAANIEENRKKRKQTCKEKYGVECTLQTEIVKEKSKQTKLKKYGNENFVNVDKKKQTCLERYNVEYVGQVKEFKEKIKQTCIEKYGVDNYLKTDIGKEKSHTKEAINKCIETKRIHHTFNTSKPEEICYELLKERYNEVIRQYKSDNYQFCCDFYIPEIDTYIEYQGIWTHGGKPYKGTEEDEIQLNKWIEKSKNSEYYKNAINVWTKMDVKKRSIALLNHLNYIELWNLDDVYKFIKT